MPYLRLLSPLNGPDLCTMVVQRLFIKSQISRSSVAIPLQPTRLSWFSVVTFEELKCEEFKVVLVPITGKEFPVADIA